MIASRVVGFACSALFVAPLAATDTGTPSSAPDVAIGTTPTEAQPLYAAPTRVDRAGRIVASVHVDGRGPYRFVVDTGANRSAISPRLAADLALSSSAGASVDLHGVTGSAILPSVDVASLRAGELEIDPGPLPVLESRVFADTDGILGMEGFDDYRIDVDFTADRVSIERSSGKRPRGAFYLVPAKNHRGLLVVDGRAGGIPVKAIIDTGAEHTLGNAPLRDLLSRRTDPRRRTQSRVIGATEQTYLGTSFVVPVLRIGSARLSNLPVTFGDMHVFRVWGLTEEPALLIGMDLIGKLRRFAVDYRRSEIQFMPYASAGAEVRKCGPTECRSRIPDPDRT
ncbi:MAG TPA: retroviral-like aspartic protease family protein [Steroidobacteraceae bacterium]|nr:retroviral-like aspartic protease family protein [Steroidobacteraceae bacterium]